MKCKRIGNLVYLSEGAAYAKGREGGWHGQCSVHNALVEEGCNCCEQSPNTRKAVKRVFGAGRAAARAWQTQFGIPGLYDSAGIPFRYGVTGLAPYAPAMFLAGKRAGLSSKTLDKLVKCFGGCR